MKQVVWISLALVLSLTVTPQAFSKTKNSSTNQTNKPALTKQKSKYLDNEADRDADWTKASAHHAGGRVDQPKSSTVHTHPVGLDQMK